MAMSTNPPDAQRALDQMFDSLRSLPQWEKTASIQAIAIGIQASLHAADPPIRVDIPSELRRIREQLERVVARDPATIALDAVRTAEQALASGTPP